MILTPKQEAGLRIAVERYKNHEPYTTIAGYAGTGKSTLVTFIIAALGLDLENVAYVAYTGKASLVLQEKGCPNATTAHKLLYNSYPRRDGTFYHKPKRPLDRDYDLIVVDEISMLPADMWDLLLSHNIHVIALGDPGQLPPIGEDNGVLVNPHVFLEDVMRQAQESEIIRLSMDIREGKSLELFKGNEVQVIDKKELVNGMYQWADQIIVGKNVTRHNINYEMRKMLFNIEDNYPVDGDRIICLRNDWNALNFQGDVLVNGLMGTIRNPHTVSNYFLGNHIAAGFDVDGGGSYKELMMDYKMFINHEPSITQDNFRKVPKPFHPHEFDYAYCITAHKSQGSEYKKVLVLEEFLKGNEHTRWLYTAVTRASEKLVLVKDYR